MELSIVKQRKEEEKRESSEEIIAIILPKEGKISVEDLGNLIGVKENGVKNIVKKNNVKYHKIVGKWIVDLEDLWNKT